MKTKEEIRNYIKGQYWSKYFESNISARGGRFLLEGRGGKWTIKAGFNWEESEQGSAYWAQVNKEFIKWFE